MRSRSMSRIVTFAPSPAAMRAALVADDSPSDDDDVRRAHAGHSAEEDPRPAARALEELRSRLDRKAPGDLAHRLEQRQAALALEGLVGEAVRAARDDAFGQGPLRGEVEVGEERLAGP